MNTLGLLAAAALAATPITVEEVRAQARAQLDAIKAELDVARAQQGTRQAVSAILPQVGLQVGTTGTFNGRALTYNQVQQSDGSFRLEAGDSIQNARGDLSLGVTVSQLLYDGGRWWNQIAQAGAQEAAARGQLEEQRLASELEAVRRFYDLLRGQLALRVFEATVQRSREQVERARALYEAGRGPRSGVFDAASNLGNDEINVVRQRQRNVQARLALLQWLGRSDEDVEAVSPATLEAPAALPEVGRALEQARAARPLIKVLSENTRAADLGVSLGWANHLPQLSLSGGYFRGASSSDLIPAATYGAAAALTFGDWSRQNVLQGSVNLKLNLFSGFFYDSQIRQAEVELTRAQAVQKQALVDLEAELRRTHDAARVEREVLDLSQKNLQVAQEQLKLEEERYSAGAGSTLEVRNAQVKFTQAQLNVLSGKAEVAVARAALERTVGGEVK